MLRITIYSLVVLLSLIGVLCLLDKSIRPQLMASLSSTGGYVLRIFGVKPEKHPKTQSSKRKEEKTGSAVLSNDGQLNAMQVDLKERQELQEALDAKEVEYDALKKDYNELEKENAALNNRCDSLLREIKKHSSKNLDTVNDEKVGQFWQKIFSPAPASMEPYGFCEKDLSMSPEHCLFVVNRINESESSFTLIDSLSVRQTIVLNSAYLPKVFNIIKDSSTNIKDCFVLEQGLLRLQNNVWIITKKITIKLI